MLLEFTASKRKFDLFHFSSKNRMQYKNVECGTPKKGLTLTFILTIKPFRNNIFKQRFGLDTQPENCFKLL